MTTSTQAAGKTTALSHRIRSISISGGFLDGARFDLEPGLNCFIGARGTGKTTVLELIRFAFDALPSRAADAAERKRIDSLVQANLAGGYVQLTVETKDGLSYLIRRSAGEEPMVLTQHGKPTEIKVKSGGLFQSDIFSQDAVEKLADEARSQLALIDNFEAQEIADIEAEIARVRQTLKSNASHILPLQEKVDQLSEQINTLPDIEDRLKAYAGNGKKADGAINQAHEKKALRDREKRAVQSLKKFLQEYSTGISSLRGQLAEAVKEHLDAEMLAGPNAGPLREIRERLLEHSKRIDQLARKATEEIAEEVRHLADASSALALAHDEQELAFRKLIEKDRLAQKQASERAGLEKARNELEAKKRERSETTKKLDKLLAERADLLRRLSDLQDRRYGVRRRIAETINEQLAPHIRVSVTQYGNRANLQRLLGDVLKTSGVKQTKSLAEKLFAVDPAEFAAAVRDNDGDALMAKADLSSDQAEKVVMALRNASQLFELETVELLDLPRIELKVGQEYRELAVLSKGQKCTAILPILLLDSARPLLVDQPEDNLDNGFIFETVVESILKVKQRRQLIFVTHNANIPVLGDAERVFVLDYDGDCSRLANEGTVDDCKKEILSLLEGGKKAFRLRAQRYGS